MSKRENDIAPIKKNNVFKTLLSFGIVEKHETNDQKEGSWIHHGFLNMLL